MFYSSVVVDVSLPPVSISSAAAHYFVHNSMATIISVHVNATHLILFTIVSLVILLLVAMIKTHNHTLLTFVAWPMMRHVELYLYNPFVTWMIMICNLLILIEWQSTKINMYYYFVQSHKQISNNGQNLSTK